MSEFLTIPSKTHSKLLSHKKLWNFFYSVISSDNENCKMCGHLEVTFGQNIVM